MRYRAFSPKETSQGCGSGTVVNLRIVQLQNQIVPADRFRIAHQLEYVEDIWMQMQEPISHARKEYIIKVVGMQENGKQESYVLL